jgi:hypothetical protein
MVMQDQKDRAGDRLSVSKPIRELRNEVKKLRGVIDNHAKATKCLSVAMVVFTCILAIATAVMAWGTWVG